MLPEIDFTFSYILQVTLLRNEFNFERLKNSKDNIEKIFYKQQDKILGSIQKLSKLRWKENYIQVWVFTGLYDSVPSPVLINCTSGDSDTMLFELVRMLSHSIFIQSGIQEVEDHIPYGITIKIMQELIGTTRLKDVYTKLELDTFKKPVLEKALSMKF